MDKRYQVFVSSTYSDLQIERQEVIQALLELECIPSGMELFPAADESQWSLIKKVISDCDYYIVVLAGRYGSIGPQGISYTEMEYRYALDIGKPIMGFLHKNPGKLPSENCESTDDGKKKLIQFRSLVENKICKHWENHAELGSVVSRSLVQTIKTRPAVGWIRANSVNTEVTASEVLSLKNRIEELNKIIENSREKPSQDTEYLSQGKEYYAVKYNFTAKPDDIEDENEDELVYLYQIKLTWDQIFFRIAPLMMEEKSEDPIMKSLSNLIEERAYDYVKKGKFKKHLIYDFKISDDSFQTIKIQLRALGLIKKIEKEKSARDKNIYWTLTPYGDKYMTQLRAIRRQPRNSQITPDTAVPDDP